MHRPFPRALPWYGSFRHALSLHCCSKTGPNHVHSTNGTKDDPNCLIASHIPQKLQVRLQPKPDGLGPKPDLISLPNNTQKGFDLTSKFASRPIAGFQLASIPSGLQEIPHTNPSVAAFPHKNGAWPSLKLGPLCGSCRPLELCPSLVDGSRWVPGHIIDGPSRLVPEVTEALAYVLPHFPATGPSWRLRLLGLFALFEDRCRS